MSADMLTVAVVMATYNGGEYIIEQLESIRNQTRRPQRVIIRDDGSSDGTHALIRRYIEDYDLRNWDYKVNANNKGFTDNFLDAAMEVTQDVVFFSDQDDVWLDSKIENALQVYKDYDDCLMVICRSKLIDSEGRIIDRFRLRKGYRDSHATKVSLDQQVSSMVASGHLISIKRKLLHEVRQYIKNNDMTYDSPLGIIAAAKDGLYRSNSIDVLHRIHASNTSNPVHGIRDRISSKDRHLEGRRFQLDVLAKCRDIVAESVDSNTLERYDQELKCRKKSVEAIRERRLGPLFLSIFRRSKMKNRRIELANFVITMLDIIQV